MTTWNGPAVKAAARRGEVKGLGTAAEYVLEQSNRKIPNEEGALERSGTTSVDAPKLQAAVSYDTPYAVAQHERLDYIHKGKGEAKFLENARNAARPQILRIIRDAIRRELRT